MLGRRGLPAAVRAVAPVAQTRSFSSARCVASPAIASLTKSAVAYPFSATARVVAAVPDPPMPRTDSILRTVNAHLTALHPNASTYLSLFSRRDKARLLPGSVLTVASYASLPTPENPDPAKTTFSGVLMAVRRRHAGRDTSFRLRNLVGRTGVEIAFKLFSPLLASVTVVARATTSGPAVTNSKGVELQRKKPTLPAERRAKLYFMRDQPNRLVSVAGIVKQARERELQAVKKRR